ncbi:MAG: COX15/CtaA family protein [Polyangiaceae bacterium]|nr:COX15/CtaA family protein [Polyangiaceae bacterium]MCW5790558.1 COX15/CtaA family protein [Polyangiaceae bacterium]
MSELSPAADAAARRFARVVWWAAGYTLFVILFGAVVRITGSGAGCGQHWPTCHGEVAHMPRSVETLIELTHRVTSGVCLPLVLFLWYRAARIFPRGHATRRYALWVTALMVVEALVGAGLVLWDLVGDNASASRAVFMALHLISTSLLMGAFTLMAWTAGRGQASQGFRLRMGAGDGRWLGALLVGFVLVSMLGAVTALGDTLYPLAPDANLSDRVTGAHFLERLRVAHPVSAVALSAGLWWLLQRFEERGSGPALRVARLGRALLVLQLVVGVVNVALSAPGYMQVTHLAVGTALWCTLVLLLAIQAATARRSEQAPCASAVT